jgi:hypothetical protein
MTFHPRLYNTSIESAEPEEQVSLARDCRHITLLDVEMLICICLAGRSGEAITLYTKDDIGLLRSIANVMKASGMQVPEWITSLPKLRYDASCI